MPFERFDKLEHKEHVIDFFTYYFPDFVDLVGEDTLVKDYLKKFNDSVKILYYRNLLKFKYHKQYPWVDGLNNQ